MCISTEGLVVRSGGEHLALTRVGMVVLASMRRVKTPPRVSIPSDRSYVEQKHVLNFACEHAALYCCAYGYHFVGVDPFRRSFAEELFHNLLMAGIRVEPPTSITSSMSDVVRPASCSALRQGSMVARMRLIGQLLEFSACEGAYQVFGIAVHRHDIGEVDLR